MKEEIMLQWITGNSTSFLLYSKCRINDYTYFITKNKDQYCLRIISYEYAKSVPRPRELHNTVEEAKHCADRHFKEHII